MTRHSEQSLHATRNPLASPEEQLRVLGNSQDDSTFKPFGASIGEAGHWPLAAERIDVVQINVGKLCNQTCKHCHVDAGPDRTEIMSRETFELCLAAIRRLGQPTVDITGGAPELNPNFRWFVEQVRSLGCHVIDRCNLTVLTLRPQQGLAEFLARHRVEIIASLPYYLQSRTDAQRGSGVFRRSIQGLRTLNELGYGSVGSGLELNLVYNPTGAFLPPDQRAIEGDFRRELRARYGIEFNALFTITNMPISRFLEFLIRSGNYQRYMQQLVNAFNPATVPQVMCRSMISIGWDGRLFDCDFNQMLGMEVNRDVPRHVSEFDPARLANRRIICGQHCYGCTAGGGSTCGGSMA